ncbi:50S ribosomal protein L35 [Nocardia sp. NPDC050406]|uniref:50S ribosomal protein L35 n=1 Tax=Nocardia sp. NPDC050406 TaxID=3364318 RepID=UPI0037B5B935
MPKNKSHKGISKRVKVTGTGKLRRARANKNHMLEKKSSRRTRRLNMEDDFSKADTKKVKRMLGM